MNGPVGFVERPTTTLYPVCGPLQQLVAEANLVDGDLAGTTDYRQVLAEVLEKRCGASGLSTVFPGLGTGRLGVVKART